MNETAIRYYERALGRAVRGIRLRRKVKKAFRAFLSALREEIDVPDYSALVEAFGPPEQMAQTLIQSLSEQPKPMSKKQKVVLAVGIFLVFAIVTIGGGSLWNQTKETSRFLQRSDCSLEKLLTNYVFVADGIFGQQDIEWNQENMFSSYTLVLKNTNQVSAKVFVFYSNYRSPHMFEVSPGEQVIFRVDDAQHSDHTISFDSPDGTFSGTVRVLAF